MVQRYEQMRRLQWYKCGAAYHDLGLSLTILLMIEDKKALFAIETCGVFVQYEVGKIVCGYQSVDGLLLRHGV